MNARAFHLVSPRWGQAWRRERGWGGEVEGQGGSSVRMYSLDPPLIYNRNRKWGYQMMKTTPPSSHRLYFDCSSISLCSLGGGCDETSPPLDLSWLTATPWRISSYHGRFSLMTNVSTSLSFKPDVCILKILLLTFCHHLGCFCPPSDSTFLQLNTNVRTNKRLNSTLPFSHSIAHFIPKLLISMVEDTQADDPKWSSYKKRLSAARLSWFFILKWIGYTAQIFFYFTPV